MTSRNAVTLLSVAGLSVALPVEAKPTNPCGTQGCPTDVRVQQTTILPADLNQFRTFGDVFRGSPTELAFGTSNAVAVSLGTLNVNFGGGVTNTAFISKDGLISFGAPLTAFQQTSSLRSLNLPVIAPYYANLAPAANDGQAGIGDVLFETGFADVYPDADATGAMVYSMADLLPAVRITWYGVTPDNGRAGLGAPIYAQLVIAGTADGSYSTFKFRYGTDQSPGEDGAGAIAGFSLYGTDLQFGGPFRGVIPSFYEFNGGQFTSQRGTGAVPEPATWAQMIAGFGLLGYALRRRRARVTTAQAAVAAAGM